MGRRPHIHSRSPARTRAPARLFAVFLGTAGLLAAAGAAGADDAPFIAQPAALRVAQWNLRLPEESKVSFRGEATFDGVGMGTGSMLYGPGPVAALAGMVTHGLLLASGRSHQRTKVQEEADQVLVPYQAVLANFTHAQLLHRTAELLTIGGAKAVTPHAHKADSDWTLEAEPVFSMTQDQRALVLDNTLWIHPAGQAEDNRFALAVRVVAPPHDAPNASAYWLADNGEPLKDESARLLAQAIDIAVRIFSGATPQPSGPFRTMRYSQGGTQKMERAQVVAASCDSLLLKSLRGAFLSVPATAQSRDPALEATCPPPGAIARTNPPLQANVPTETASMATVVPAMAQRSEAAPGALPAPAPTTMAP